MVGLARGAVFFYGVQLAWVFLLGASWTYGEVFHPAVVPEPISISLLSSSLELYVTWIVYYVSICHVPFSLFVNKPSAWFEASRTQGL